MAGLDKDKVYREFADAVNMGAAELEEWLESEESRRVGWNPPDGRGGGESVGHASGRRIARILRTQRAGLTDADFAHMRKTVGFIRRHRAQEPANAITSRWRYSLMNWGHDPMKDMNA
ncbi:MAG TPA: DUF3140 domain-containing protein [Allosphingosinicella sp.]|jgi:hypothetical protein|nr:DUF3140 domain-containing protein [Allosphingosinicella sp.]